MKTFNINNKRGFTLVEVLVVVLLIGMLTMMGIPYYKDHIEKQKAALGISNLTIITDALERHMALHSESVPTKFTLLNMDVRPEMLSDGGTKYDDGNFVYTINTGGYVNAARNTGEYTLKSYWGNNPRITCTSSTDGFCADKLNIQCDS